MKFRLVPGPGAAVPAIIRRSEVAGAFVDASRSDVDALHAQGWITLAPAGTSKERPENPPVRALFFDTDLDALITWLAPRRGSAEPGRWVDAQGRSV